MVMLPSRVVIGVRSHCPLHVRSGVFVVLILIGGTSGGAMATGPLPRVDQYQGKPTSLVIQDLMHKDLAVVRKAANEIERRLKAGQLAQRDASWVAEVCLAAQKQATPPATAPQPLLNLLGALYDLFSTNARELEKTKADYDDLTNKFEAALAAAKARDEEFTSEINQLKQQYADLARESAAFSDKTRQEIESLQADWEEERKHIGDERDEERRRREEVEKALNQERGRNEKLLAQLAAFRPSEGAGSLLQIKDGHVVRTFARNDIVYIDLGRRDGLKPGMTFSVYSADRGIPADGRGKAAIEVTNLDDKTSECRVTTKTPSDPILEGDVIANPVFDKSRQFNFAVAGDFDLDFDGMIDDPGGKQVARLIRGWGGKVVSRVNTRTDFVVWGWGRRLCPPTGRPTTSPTPSSNGPRSWKRTAKSSRRPRRTPRHCPSPS